MESLGCVVDVIYYPFGLAFSVGNLLLNSSLTLLCLFLKDPSDRRRIICDEKLKELFDVDSFNGFTVSKLLTAHFIKREQWVAPKLILWSLCEIGIFVCELNLVSYCSFLFFCSSVYFFSLFVFANNQ